MQIESVATNAGVATSAAASRIACRNGRPISMWPVVVLDLHRRVVHQDPHRQRQPAQRHDVQRLVQRVQHADGDRIESGIEVATISVLRQHRRNSRIINPVRQAAITPSRTTPEIEERTNTLWSNRKSTLRLLGIPARILGSIAERP